MLFLLIERDPIRRIDPHPKRPATANGLERARSITSLTRRRITAFTT
jgi:hypothetical protein